MSIILSTTTPPDQRAFEVHVGRASFVAGVLRGDWSIESVDWPIVVLTISAATRARGPRGFALRCNLTNFPAEAPTATPWDVQAEGPLPATMRPKGEHVGMVFRTDWEDGRALYAPYDRIALAGHQNWAAEHPRYVWTGHQDLTWWAQRIWDMLNSDDYVGI